MIAAGPTYVFDIEANGLMRQATEVYQLVLMDLDTEELYIYRKNETEDTIAEGVQRLASAHRLVAHNGVMYDVPVLERLYGVSLPTCIDTLLISRLLYPDQKNHPVGGNGLEAWGRYLKHPKLPQPANLLEGWSPEMETYCIGDVQLTAKVYRHLAKRAKPFRQAVVLEHQVAEIIRRQIVNGFTFDEDAALALKQALDLEYARVYDELQKAFPPKTIEMKSRLWKDPNGGLWETKKQARSEGGWKPTQLKPGPHKTRLEPFNPGSRPQIAERLIDKYGWKPTKQTEHGSIVVDEKVLGSLPYPEARLLERFLLVQKRQSQLDQWFTLCDPNTGRVHGEVITNGCVSGRMSHNKPNMAQVPRVNRDKSTKEILWGPEGGFGAECRSCFAARPGWWLVGADASGLELRMLAHYMAQWDGGAYAEVILNGDIHTHNQQMAGIDTRDNAKTFISKG